MDEINHPAHYKARNGIEAIDVIDAFDLGYHLGNAMKYLLRAGRKGGPDLLGKDLAKARWYLQRWLAVAPQGLAYWPEEACARPTAEPWYVAESFELVGPHRAAVIAILEAGKAELGDDCVDLIRHAHHEVGVALEAAAGGVSIAAPADFRVGVDGLGPLLEFP